MERALASKVKADLDDKIVLLTGPRQSGKTTLSRSLFESFDYLNFDIANDRLRIREQSWDRTRDLVVFDEIHKMKNWKGWLKGVYDERRARPRLLVTGSARMDTYRKVGDSLAGRFFQHRLHPFDLKELAGHEPARESFDRLMKIGGFPEPFLKGSETFYRRWRRSHLDIVLRQDLMELETVSSIQGIETLTEMLRHRVGQTVSAASLARDLERDPKTIKRWLQILENLYVIFRATPYHHNIARSLLKEPKFYFYDNGQVIGDEGQRFENLVACALHKELHRLEDDEGFKTSLHFLRTKDGKEIDFLVCVESKPLLLLETKWSNGAYHKAFPHFLPSFTQAKRQPPRQVLLCGQLKAEKTYPDGLEVRDAVKFLPKLDLAP